MTAHELRYTVRSAEQFAEEYLPTCATEDVREGLTARVVATDDDILIEPAGSERLKIDCRTRERLYVDDDREVYARRPEPVETAAEGPTIERTDTRRRDETGRQVRLSRLSLDGWTVSVWTRPFPEGGGWLRELWRYLLPADTDDLLSLGMPVEIRMAPDGRGVDEGVHLKLQDHREASSDATDLRVPEGYTPLGDQFDDDPTLAADDPKIDFEAGLAADVTETLELADAVDSLETSLEAAEESDTMSGIGEGVTDGVSTVTSRQGLSPGADLAWIERFDFLDTIKRIVNDVSGSFGTFSGKGPNGEMQVTVDWWSQLKSALTFTDSQDDDITEESIDAIKRLVIYVQVFNGAQSVGGMNSGQQQRYRNSVLPKDSQLARFSAYISEFGIGQKSETQSIADRYWKDITKPQTAELGPKEIKKSNVDNLIDLRLWDFDTELRIKGKPVVDTLSFTTDGLELVVEIDELFARFEYETSPAGTVGSTACQVLTLGICAEALHSRGKGRLSVSDIQIAVDLTRTRTGSTLGFDATLDKSETSTNASIDFDTGGLSNPVLSGLAKGGQELQQTVDEKLTSAVTERLEDFPPDSIPRWPNTWKAKNGPTLSLRGGEIDDDEHVLRADVAQRSGLSGRPGGVDTDPVNSLGYALSEAYLEAWVREYTGVLAETVTVQTDVENELDVSLPDPSTQDDDPGDAISGGSNTSCGVDPALPDPEFENAVRLKRTAPSVYLPPDGHSEKIATLTMDYEARVAAVKTKYFSEAIVEEMECGVVGGRPRGGAQPDPAPPMSGAAVMMLDAGYTMGDLLSRTGLKVGASPSTVARQRLATYGGQFQGAGVDATHGTASGALASRGLGRDQVVWLNRLTTALLANPNVEYPIDPGSLPVGTTPAPGEGPLPPDDPWPPDDPMPDEDDDIEDILDGLDGIPVGPGGGGGGRGGRVVCKPPDCTTVIDSVEGVVEEYMAAEVTVEAPLYVGFQERGAPWHPEIRLAGDGQTVTDVRVTDTASELQSVHDSTLENFAESVVTDDARNVLGSLPDKGSLRMRRLLVPDIAGTLLKIPNPVLELVEFDQGGSFDSLAYDSTGSHGVWAIEIDEQVSDHIGGS